MKRRGIIALIISLALVFCLPGVQAWAAQEPQYNATYGTGDSAITVATGSPGSLGLLKELIETNADHGLAYGIARGMKSG